MSEHSSRVTSCLMSKGLEGLILTLWEVTAGILFLLQRKRKWERIRKHEEQLLALKAAPGYKSSSRTKESDKHGSSRRGSSPSRPSEQYSRSSAEKSPPRYQRLAHADYIPTTTYRGEERPVSTTEILNGRRTAFLGAVVAPRQREREYGQRPSSFHQSFGGSHQLVVPRSREQLFHVRSHSELSSMMIAHSNSTDEPRSSSQMEHPFHHRHSASTSSAPLPDEGHLPKKPKPVLSRLVTNF